VPTPTPTPACQITVDFSADQCVGAENYCTGETWVQFHDLSTGNINRWEWDLIGNGLIDSYARNPLYYYTVNGPHTVTLTVYGPDCPDGVSLTKSYYIWVGGCTSGG